MWRCVVGGGGHSENQATQATLTAYQGVPLPATFMPARGRTRAQLFLWLFGVQFDIQDTVGTWSQHAYRTPKTATGRARSGAPVTLPRHLDVF
jgi:hypothetical protein